MSKLKPNQFLLGSHLITERPILFQTEMVKANLGDRKTQTRRGKGLDNFNWDPDYWSRKGNPMKHICRFWDGTKEADPNPLRIEFGFRNPLGSIEYVKSIYGKPGDLLWVKETWGRTAFDNEDISDSKIFKADYQYPDIAKKGLASDNWKPSIHMPKCFARIWAMVEDVRAERLQDISEEDAIAEGCSLYGPFGEFRGSLHPNGGSMRYRAYSKASRAFQCIWEEINGTASWKANPWVWVIKYRILSKTGRPAEKTILHNYLNIVKGEKNFMTI